MPCFWHFGTVRVCCSTCHLCYILDMDTAIFEGPWGWFPRDVSLESIHSGPPKSSKAITPSNFRCIPLINPVALVTAHSHLHPPSSPTRAPRGRCFAAQDEVVSGRCGLKAALYAHHLENPRAVCDLTVLECSGGGDPCDFHVARPSTSDWGWFIASTHMVILRMVCD